MSETYEEGNERHLIQREVLLNSEMNKNIRVSNLTYEMLVEVARKRRPSMKPEALLEQTIKDLYSQIR
jgi:DNA modification methylase|nr:hypothetical protein [Algoriphagus sp.]|tara:strand:+ start:454 stop:657 length:204 start_codon:yes stop_codon:yes gene_type:complete